jgi:hypothetical protein
MDLTKFMLNTPAGRTKKEDKLIRQQVAMGLGSYIKKGLGETQPEADTRKAIERSNAFQKVFSETEAARDGLFAIGDNDFQLIPMFQSEGNQQRFVFKDQTLSITGYLTTVAANCGASYAASKALFGTKIDAKRAGVGLENEWSESIVANGAGFLTSYVLGSLATVGDSFLENKIQGIFTLPADSDLIETQKDDDGTEHVVAKSGAKDAIMKQIKETDAYKNSSLGMSKWVNLGLSIANGAALGFHGFKRYENKPDQEKYLMTAGFALGGIFGLTNLGYAFAQGFAQPCCEEPNVYIQQAQNISNIREAANMGIGGPVEVISVEEERSNPRKRKGRRAKARKHSKSVSKASKAGKKKSSYKRHSR